MNYTEKQKRRQQSILSKIKQFRLFDDEFMSKVFEDDIEATEFLLRIILQRDDLTVTESKGQFSIKNLQGRSVRLDIKAKDKEGKLYNIEVQRADEGAGSKRARYNSAILDCNSLMPGESIENLPETYIIFITEHDVLGCGLPLYHIERTVKENNMTFDDKAHIIYVNGEFTDDSDIGKLMHDFSCADPCDMKYKLLAEKTGRFKNDTKGEKQMSKLWEDFLKEEREDEREEIAMNMLEDGSFSTIKIAELTKLSEARVQELAEEIKAAVASR